MSKLMDQLKIDHSNICKLLCILEKQIQRLQDGEESAEPMLIIQEILDYLRQYPTVCHHPREELIIEMLIELLEPADQATNDKVMALKAEHSNIEQLLPEIYQQVNLAVESSYQGMIEQIKIFLDFYYQHIESEERLLFPLAMELFSDDDWREMDSHFEDIMDPLFSAHDETEHHFLRLQEIIIEHDKGKIEEELTTF